MTLVVDASIAIKWLVAEPGHEFAAALLLNFPATSAPDFVVVEVGNVLWKKARRAELSVVQAEQALASLPQFFDALFPARRFVGRALQISLGSTTRSTIACISPAPKKTPPSWRPPTRAS